LRKPQNGKYIGMTERVLENYSVHGVEYGYKIDSPIFDGTNEVPLVAHRVRVTAGNDSLLVQVYNDMVSVVSL